MNVQIERLKNRRLPTPAIRPSCVCSSPVCCRDAVHSNVGFPELRTSLDDPKPSIDCRKSRGRYANPTGQSARIRRKPHTEVSGMPGALAWLPGKFQAIPLFWRQRPFALLAQSCHCRSLFALAFGGRFFHGPSPAIFQATIGGPEGRWADSRACRRRAALKPARCLSAFGCNRPGASNALDVSNCGVALNRGCRPNCVPIGWSTATPALHS
ncbi:hypothetical protein OKW49_007854 [Paraburkholderia youngii]